jgi:lipopolysaccharide transport protein LptA
LTAETAVQDIKKPDQLELQNLRAEIEMADADILVVTAKSGTYHTKIDKVTLREHVVFTTAQGLNAKLREAVVDMKKGTLQSDQVVDFKLPSGRVQANAVEIEDGRRGGAFHPRRHLRPRCGSTGGEEVMGRRAAAWLPMSIGLTLACALGAAAQPAGQAQQPASTAPGLSMDSDQPVRIESNTLEVRDKIRQATFAGDVKLTQGDTIIKCKVLVVFYEDTAAPAKKAAPPATAGGQPAQKNSQKIKRAECKGDVFVVQKEQTATGENAVFEMKANTVVITGSVVVTQGRPCCAATAWWRT